MKHYKTPTNKIYAFEPDGSQDHFITKDMVPVSDAELAILRAPVPLTYQQLRIKEYPPATDYLDAVVKGDSVQLSTYAEACLAVKAKYPKPA